jgi:hypothetical protein
MTNCTRLTAPDATLPLLIGILRRPLTAFRGRPSNCRIHVLCPFCGETHVHGWALDGSIQAEERVAHCGDDSPKLRPRTKQRLGDPDYMIRPARPGEPGFANHEFSPRVRVPKSAKAE